MKTSQVFKMLNKMLDGCLVATVERKGMKNDVDVFSLFEQEGRSKRRIGWSINGFDEALQQAMNHIHVHSELTFAEHQRLVSLIAAFDLAFASGTIEDDLKNNVNV